MQTKYTADPALLVHEDTLYLYTSHDEDDADGFTMYDCLLYSTKDLVNWTDHGISAGVREPPEPSPQITPKLPRKKRCSRSVSSNACIKGASLFSGRLGSASYQKQP